VSGSPDLRALYRERVLEHSRAPHNFRRLEHPDRLATGHNALCGDKLTMYVRLAGDRVGEVAFEATGCAISLASASLLTDIVPGRTVAEARAAVAGVMAALAPGGNPPALPAGCEDMAALGGVRDYPSRVRCATLAWKTLDAALAGDAAPVTTE
jgi:nitrogen fixation NifU-like protein